MTIHYPDVSGYQAGLSLAGAPAAMAKATEGVGYRDPLYIDFKAQAAAARIPFSAYHFLRHGNAGGQASFALSVVGTGTPLMVDVETAGDGSMANLDDLYQFVDAYRSLGGVVTTVYLPHWYWQGLGSPSLAGMTQRNLALISSNYTTYSDTGPGWAPYGGVTPTIWQYSATYPFNGQEVDMNAFKGSVEQLAALFNGKQGDDMASVIQTTDDHGNTVFMDPQGHTFCRIPKAPTGQVGVYWPLQNKLDALAHTGVTVVAGSSFGWGGGYNMDDPTAWVWAGVEVKPEGAVMLSDEQLAAVEAAAKAGAEAGAPTHDELAQAAFDGAQRAESE